MGCFVVILFPGSSVSPEKIGTHFPNNHTLIPNQAWVVAGEQPTCADVCRTLGIADEKATDPSGIVIRANEYYGFADASLWDHMRVWEG